MIVLELRDDEAARSIWNEYKYSVETHRGVSAVCEYVTAGRPGAARLTALYRERALDTWEGPGWELAMPAPPPPGADVNLSAVHFLRLEDPADSAWLLAELTRDRRVKRAYRPAVQQLQDGPEPLLNAVEVRRLARAGDLSGFIDLVRTAGIADFGMLAGVARLLMLIARDQEQWGLNDCGFRKVWPELDRDTGYDGRIAVIDDGPYYRHPELDGRITEINVLPPQVPHSTSPHASAVAAVISALRVPAFGIHGCCSAPIDLYNVFDTRRADPEAYCIALKMVPKSKAKVVNLSLGAGAPDDCVREQIRECVDAGIVLVAAAGDVNRLGGGPVYPAAYKGVIGVGATDPSGNRVETSSTGAHVDVSAPGVGILSTLGQDGLHFWNGTSFAAPMASAAAWLALNIRNSWKGPQIETLLKCSSTGRGRRVRDLGYGRLDLVKLAEGVDANDPTCGVGAPEP